MPLGYERLNERSQRPNPNINFIKPLTSSSPQDQAIAKDFLERIAAQCYPIMKEHYISVNALEEFPPNREFLGRNFNAGECIQLVLKDKAGRWLSFKFVQKVMMHELAHCKQMNHSRAFWKVRNQYSGQMDELWAKKYEGEGVWGRGQNLTSGAFVHDRMPDSADIPEHLCGGTYRRRGKKRKRGQDAAAEKPKVTYKERQQKRVNKKFGIYGGGQRLGDDLMVRGALEEGNRQSGNPTVAQSKRGRELRANAALARFEATQQPKIPYKPIDLDGDYNDDHGYGSFDETSDEEDDDNDPLADLERVCGDEGEENDGGEEEKDELRLMGVSGFEQTASQKGGGRAAKAKDRTHEDSETESETDDVIHVKSSKRPANNGTVASGGDGTNRHGLATRTKPIHSVTDSTGTYTDVHTAPSSSLETGLVTCPICSLENESSSPTCMACAHVLKPSLMKGHWRCKSDECKGTSYINAGDVGRCGICGSQKPAPRENKTAGMLSSDVLRWD